MAEGEKHIVHWWQARESMRAKGEGFHFIKPSTFTRLNHYHETSMGETTHDSMISHRSLPQHWGIMGATIQDVIWVRTQPDYMRCKNNPMEKE